MSSPSFAIAAYAPEALARELGEAAGSPPWITRIQDQEGATFFIALRPLGPSTVTLDAATAPVLIADLLRAGWPEIARAHTQPIVAADDLYRGFTLERDLTLLVGRAERWRLDCLMPRALSEEFVWTAAVATLDAFVASLLRPLAAAESAHV